MARVHFSPLPAETIESLIAEGSVFHCAGGLMVEHALVAPHVTRIEGGMDSVMGLSKATVVRLLEQAPLVRLRSCAPPIVQRGCQPFARVLMTPAAGQHV